MGYMRHRHQRPVLRAQVSTQPAIAMKKEPAAKQVLAQMSIKSEAPTPDELVRLLRDRSDSYYAYLSNPRLRQESSLFLFFCFVCAPNVLLDLSS
jgi:hypothetical protein